MFLWGLFCLTVPALSGNCSFDSLSCPKISPRKASFFYVSLFVLESLSLAIQNPDEQKHLDIPLYRVLFQKFKNVRV